MDITNHQIFKSRRKFIFKKGLKAKHYFEYVEEVGCDVWEELSNIPRIMNEPIGLWFPDDAIPKDCSKYVQGVDVPYDYNEQDVPNGYDIIDLPAMKFMVYQTPPYNDDDFMDVINAMTKYINNIYTNIDSEFHYQLEPRGFRGYIEVVEIFN